MQAMFNMQYWKGICIKIRDHYARYRYNGYKRSACNRKQRPMKSVHFGLYIRKGFLYFGAVDVFYWYTEVGFIFDINSKTVCDKFEKIGFKNIRDR